MGSDSRRHGPMLGTNEYNMMSLKGRSAMVIADGLVGERPHHKDLAGRP